MAILSMTLPRSYYSNSKAYFSGNCRLDCYENALLTVCGWPPSKSGFSSQSLAACLSSFSVI